MNDFDKWTYDSLPFFSLSGLTGIGRLVDIYDGDSMTVIIKFNESYIKIRVRIDGIDCCEINSKDKNILEKAILARNTVAYLCSKDDSTINIQNKKEIRKYFNKNLVLVNITCKGFDKYGRVLADVYTCDENSVNIGEYLLSNKLAYSYEGGKKMDEFQ